MIDKYPFNSENLSWSVDKDDPMKIVIMYKGQTAMKLFLGEAMESAGRKNVMKHVRECDNSPWLTKWGADEEIINRLKGQDK